MIPSFSLRSAMPELASRLGHWLDCSLGGAALLALHEVQSMEGHWQELRARLSLALERRPLREWLRLQRELSEESRLRRSRDREVRRQLLRGWRTDLRQRTVPRQAVGLA